jgi:hypothetical protein
MWAAPTRTWLKKSQGLIISNRNMALPGMSIHHALHERWCVRIGLSRDTFAYEYKRWQQQRK